MQGGRRVQEGKEAVCHHVLNVQGPPPPPADPLPAAARRLLFGGWEPRPKSQLHASAATPPPCLPTYLVQLGFLVPCLLPPRIHPRPPLRLPLRLLLLIHRCHPLPTLRVQVHPTRGGAPEMEMLEKSTPEHECQCIAAWHRAALDLWPVAGQTGSAPPRDSLPASLQGRAVALSATRCPPQRAAAPPWPAAPACSAPCAAASAPPACMAASNHSGIAEQQPCQGPLKAAHPRAVGGPCACACPAPIRWPAPLPLGQFLLLALAHRLGLLRLALLLRGRFLRDREVHAGRWARLQGSIVSQASPPVAPAPIDDALTHRTALHRPLRLH